MTSSASDPLGPQITTQNIVIRQGATFRARYTWTEGGVAQPLEGFEARLGIARKRGRVLITEITSAAGEIVLEPPDDNGDPQTGTLEFFIPPEKTSRVTKTGYYDLVLIDTTDPTEVVRLLEGAVILDPMTTPTTEPQ